jgi:hypothetical protein
VLKRKKKKVEVPYAESWTHCLYTQPQFAEELTVGTAYFAHNNINIQV